VDKAANGEPFISAIFQCGVHGESLSRMDNARLTSMWT